MDLDALGAEALRRVEAAASVADVDAVRVEFLGKKGKIAASLQSLGALPVSERPKIGALANAWKQKIEAALDARKGILGAAELSARLAQERTDLTLPGRVLRRGSLHPVTQTFEKVARILGRIGFDVTFGPEVETEYLNFDAVNIPGDHPARAMHDTFFINPGVVLRTHTSPVQMRTMLKQKWPVRILCPGAVYRCDSDATHSPMFHQVEGLWVDRNVTIGHLKGVLQYLVEELFGSGTRIRLRSSFFPFVEPGAEVDVSCFQCGKSPRDGCGVCKGTGWLEVLGAGMVHPKLFIEAGYLKEGETPEMTGFAFGLGIDRLAMLLHKINDLRWMFSGDRRFLEQF